MSQMTLQSSLEPRMLQIVSVQGGHDDYNLYYVFLYFAEDQIESRSVLLLCLHHVTSHSIEVT